MTRIRCEMGFPNMKPCQGIAVGRGTTDGRGRLFLRLCDETAAAAAYLSVKEARKLHAAIGRWLARAPSGPPRNDRSE